MDNDFAETMQRHEDHEKLVRFITESNLIENIRRPPTPEEIKAHQVLLKRKRLKVEHVAEFVSACQPNAVLRATENIPGVRVGSHIAPPSGPQIVADLTAILTAIQANERTPFEMHREYETLHPFTDGNGRSGRVLWLWHMQKCGPREMATALHYSFLRYWYYTSLADVQTQKNRAPKGAVQGWSVEEDWLR